MDVEADGDFDNDFQDAGQAEEDLFANLPDDVLNGSDKENQASESQTVQKPKKAKKNATSAPSLKDKLLCSKVGIEALVKVFEDVRFKGKNNEIDDVTLLLNKYEAWAHRMFPRKQFEDVVEDIEELGRSKQMRSHVYKIAKGENAEDNADNNDDNGVEENHENMDTVEDTVESMNINNNDN